MIRNKQSARAFVSFLVTWSFLVLTVTGLVLYVVPHGRISRWLDWSLMGLGTEAWQDVHILFGRDTFINRTRDFPCMARWGALGLPGNVFEEHLDGLHAGAAPLAGREETVEWVCLNHWRRSQDRNSE